MHVNWHLILKNFTQCLKSLAHPLCESFRSWMPPALPFLGRQIKFLSFRPRLAWILLATCVDLGLGSIMHKKYFFSSTLNQKQEFQHVIGVTIPIAITHVSWKKWEQRSSEGRGGSKELWLSFKNPYNHPFPKSTILRKEVMLVNKLELFLNKFPQKGIKLSITDMKGFMKQSPQVFVG